MRKILVTIILLLNLISSDSLSEIHNREMYIEDVTLIKNKKILILENLHVSLVSFTHKRPFRGGPTKATAWLKVQREMKCDTIGLSVHSEEGKAVEAQQYGAVRWNKYIFKLLDFAYDDSISIEVTHISECE